MPEGDALHRAARRLQPLVGEQVEVETPNPRAQVGRIAEQLDGRRLLSVEAVGKNLLLTLRGRLRPAQPPADERPLDARPAGHRRAAAARGSSCAARATRRVQWNGPVLELHARGIRRLGPDILAARRDLDAMVREHPPGRPGPRGRRRDARPAARRRDRQQVEGGGAVGRRALAVAAARRDDRRRSSTPCSRRPRGQMRGSLDGRATPNRVYRRVGRPCPRCGERIRLARPGRRQPDRVLVPGLPALIQTCDPEHRLRPSRAGPGGGDRDRQENTIGMTVAAPHLYDALRAFCLAAFARLGPEAEQGEIPFVRRRAQAASTSTGRSSATTSRRARTRSRSSRTRGSRSTSCVASRPRRSSRAAPADGPSADRTLFRAILLPLLVSTGRGLRRLRLGGRCLRPGLRRARALAVRRRQGVHGGGAARRPLGRRPDRARPRDPRRDASTRSARWPEAKAAPSAFGQTRATCVPLERDAARREVPPDAPGELADAVTALRLATGAPVAAGPLVFEQLDRHPLGARPLLGIAATEPAGEPTRLDPWRGKLAADLLGGSPRPSTTASSARRSSAGSSRCSRPSRSARSACARRSPRCSAGPTGSGRRRCGRPCWSARSPSPAARARVDGLRGLARGCRRGCGDRGRRAADLRRERSCTRTGPAARRPSTRRCSGCAARPRATSRRGRVRRDEIGTELPRSRASRPCYGRSDGRGPACAGAAGADRGARPGACAARRPAGRACGRCSPRRRRGRAPSGRSRKTATDAVERCRESSADRKSRDSSRTLLA